MLEKIKSFKRSLPFDVPTADLYRSWLHVCAKLKPEGPETYPDFLCIGAPRSGTSWLFNKLYTRPDVYMPWFKEIHFFDEPLPSHDTLREKRYYDLDNEADWRWYSLLYRPGKNRIKGDITPAYMLLSVERILKIKKHMPDVKLIFIMRNPIERAWSGTRRSLWSDYGKTASDLDSEEELRDFVFSPSIIDRGDYMGCIERWESVFDAQQIKYMFFEDLFAEPEGQLVSICEFLGIAQPSKKRPDDLTRKINAAPFEQPPKSIQSALCEHYSEQIDFLERKFERDLQSWRGSVL